jgi:hypothetical protein
MNLIWMSSFCVPYVTSFSGLFLFCLSSSCVPYVTSFCGLFLLALLRKRYLRSGYFFIVLKKYKTRYKYMTWKYIQFHTDKRHLIYLNIHFAALHWYFRHQGQYQMATSYILLVIYVTITDGYVTIFQIRLQTLIQRNIGRFNYNYSLFVDL